MRLLLGPQPETSRGKSSDATLRAMLSLLSASLPCDLRASSPPFPLSFEGKTREVSYFANEDTLMLRQQTLQPKVKPLISDRASV